MVANSDLQIWQDTVKGINESGKIDLTQEEWSALTVLNGSLSSGNFSSDESFSSYQVLNENLKNHDSNPILHTHLYNFLALCNKYGAVQKNSKIQTIPTNNTNMQSAETVVSTNKTKRGGNKNLIFIIAALVVGFLVYSNWDTVREMFGRNGLPNGRYTPTKEYESFAQSAIQAIIIDGNKFTQVMPVTGIKITANYTYSDGTIHFTEGGITAGIACEYRNDTLYYSGIPFTKKTNAEIVGNGEKTDGHEQHEQTDTVSNKQAIEQQAMVDYRANLIDSSQKIQTTQQDVPQSQNPNSAIPGRFPQASERLLTVSDLQNLSKEDLKIMRNEIFARHGYIFQTQDMKTYFQNQGWYSPQRSNVTAQLSNIEIKNVDLIKGYENNTTSSVSTKCAPPIENTTGYANASVLLPKDWDGKSILANGFVWIGANDIKLQNKYNVHPGDKYRFYDDHETWDDNDTFYKYPLSPNVIIEAGGYDSTGSWHKPQKMNVNEFANYMRGLGWGVEKAENAYGIVANVTYNNGMITKIVEKYTP